MNSGKWSLFLTALVVVVLSTSAYATPYFLIDSVQEWQEAMSTANIVPMWEEEWSYYMQHWNLYLVEGEPYPPNQFVQPTLYVWPGGGGGGLDPEDAGLVMVWTPEVGSPDVNYSSGWKYDYHIDPDLTGSTITVTITPPQLSPLTGNQVTNVSFGVQDINGFQRSWHWGVGAFGPLPWNVPTTITINPGVLGVNATNPPATGFANNPFFNLTMSQQLIFDENAIWVANVGVPPPGQQIPGIWNYWHNIAVTPPIPPKVPDPLKWSQPPVECIPGHQPPIFIGWDEKSLYHQPPICADDWECRDARPVTNIHWWGSFLGWTQPNLPPQMPKAFHLAIWTDVPANPPEVPFSHPGQLIWEHFCDNYTVNFAGYDCDPRQQTENESCFQFHQYLPDGHWFFQEPDPTGRRVYWLSIAAVYDSAEVQYPWGWKTRPHFFNDDAVQIWQVTDPSGVTVWPPKIGCSWAQGQEIQYPLEQSWDLAFELTTVEMPEEWDWGDAPDGVAASIYPTLAVNNGARHAIVPGLCLGSAIDSEQDGQPTSDADGDDVNPPFGPDDEDGVVFNSLLIPGQNATCTVTATVPTGVNPVLNAWIDFNKNGSWADAGEQIAIDLPIANGSTVITFPVPSNIGAGFETFARFRLSTIMGLSFAGPADDGEVEDYKVAIGYKWVQRPDLSHLGVDVNCTAPYILADDFKCDVTGPITDIHIWCSWYHDVFVPDPGAVKFRLSIHADVPAGPYNYSMPGEVLWWHEFEPGNFAWQWEGSTNLLEGWMNPPEGYEFPGDHNCIRYDFVILEKPFIQRGSPDNPVVYWLDIQAEPLDSNARIGWKTSLEHWNDDAVWGSGREPYSGQWYELRYPPQHELYGQSIDLAFAITGVAEQPTVGTLEVKQNHTIRDHFWWPGHPDPENEMISILGAADLVENISWTDVTLQARGSGNDATDVLAVRVWADNDNSGTVSAGDVLLGTGTYPVDNGSVTIPLVPAPTVPAGGVFPIVISYALANSAPIGSTYWFNVVGASGVGQSSGLPVTVVITPDPLASARKIVGYKPITIGQAKQLAIGTPFLLEGKICTANFQATMSLVYIEESDRSAGIGILTNMIPIPPVSEWDRVSVLGVCRLINRSELVVSPQEIVVIPVPEPVPSPPRFAVGMSNKWTGGGDFGSQPAVFDIAGPTIITKSVGLNNIGMLITTWGRVTYHEGNFPWRPFLSPPFEPPIPVGNMFWIDDGTNLIDGFLKADGSYTKGIACWIGSAPMPNVDEYLSVTGILRAVPSPIGWPIFPEPVRLLVPRSLADLVIYEQQ
ncbi:MAG: DUF7901 domain-containing protein [Armatimonadota bacterium]